MALFAVTYRYVQDAALLDRVRPEHRAFLADLHESGTLIASGPFVGGEPGALLLLQGEHVGSIETVLEADPFRREGAIDVREIREWNVVIGSLQPSPTEPDPAS